MRFLKYMLLGITFMLFAAACCAASARIGEGLAIMAIPFAITGFVIKDNNGNKSEENSSDKNNDKNNKE